MATFYFLVFIILIVSLVYNHLKAKFRIFKEGDDMLSNRKRRPVGNEQVKKSVSKELGKRFKTSNTNSLRNIGRKNSFGSSNWNNFVKMENLKLDSSAIPNQRSGEQQRKLPLMKSSPFNSNNNKFQPFKQANRSAKVTNAIGIDCEMVGVGPNGSESVLARVSLVNSYCECIYDKYVKPTVPVTDYRTFVSGIRPHDLENGEDFYKVQSEVAEILKGRTLVGHALKHDLQVLMLSHPKKFIRDTITFMKFRNEVAGTLSLKNLAQHFLSVKIQDGEHDSVEDARAAMQLYMTYRKEWEKEHSDKWQSHHGNRKNFASSGTGDRKKRVASRTIVKNFAPVGLTVDDV